AIDERHAPAPAVHAEVGVLGHDAEVAPESELHAAGDRGALDRGDHRLVELEARRAERPAGNLATVAARPGRGEVELAQRGRRVQRAHELEVPSRAERSAGAP